MILPETGSVVIIDDKANQAIPILKALSKKGVSATWYPGTNEDDLPAQPSQIIRLAIVDLQLIEGDNDGHTIATRLVHILQRLIAPDNGPYMLLIWSLKDSLYGEDLKREISREQNGIVPSCIISLDKSSCIKRKEELGAKELADLVAKELQSGFDEEDVQLIKSSIENNWISNEESEYEALPNAVDIIEKAISEELKKAGVFHLFVIWENLIKKAAAGTVNDIARTINQDEHWESNMRDVFRRMAVARIGKNEVDNITLLKESILTLIQSFTDNLEAKVKTEEFPDYISLDGKKLIQLLSDGDNYQLVTQENSLAIFKNKINILEAGDFDKLERKVLQLDESPNKVNSNLLLDSYSTIPLNLNNSLHLEISPTKDHLPGNIFEISITDRAKKAEYLKTYFKNLDDVHVDEIQFVELEISPICDYAQKKWKKSRLISGIIYPAKLDKSLLNKDHFYPVEPNFFLNSINSKIVFDCHLFKALDIKIVEDRDVKYRLKRELLLDIIAKVSSHVNRPGISFVK